MAEPQTCGQWVADHAVLPAMLAEVTEALADNLQVHMKALDLDDEAARQEHAVYLRLAEEHRQAAARLRALGQDMAAPRDLPMGGHDEQALAAPDVAEAFQRFVGAKQELAALLQRMLEDDRRMLAGMAGPGGGDPARPGA
jgi:hypothetical protein